MADQLTSDLAALRIEREVPPPRARSRRWTFLLGIAVAATVIVVGSWLLAPIVKATFFRPVVNVVEITAVSPRQAQSLLTATGYVVPQVAVDVSAKIAGRLEKVAVQEGSIVRKGQLLFELDTGDQRAQVAAAQARVDAALARSRQVRAQLAEIAQQRDRQERLAAQHAVPPATAEDLAAHARSFEEQVHAADADVVSQQAEVRTLETSLANAVIRAPLNGIVVSKPLLPGDVVSPGTPLARIDDFTSIVVETDVPEGRLHAVRKGGPCDIVLDAWPDHHWRGEVVDVSPQLNRAKATATAKVRFLDRDEAVLPEMAARVSFLETPVDPAHLNEPSKRVAPASAIVDRGGSKVVFVVDGSTAHVKPVRVGAAIAGGVELLDGPPAGTRIINEPPPSLGDGASIQERSVP